MVSENGETHTHEFAGFNVLILVVMEDGLRGQMDSLLDSVLSMS